MKAKEPAAGYYTQPMINALKDQIVESIHQEKDIDKLNQCMHILGIKHSPSNNIYTDSYFEKQKQAHLYLKGTPMPCCYSDAELSREIEESEKSGIADPTEVNAFFAQWKRAK